MRTLSLPLDVYRQDLKKAEKDGYIEGLRRMAEVLKAFQKKDYSEAIAILVEDLDNEGVKLFEDIAFGEPDALAFIEVWKNS